MSWQPNCIHTHTHTHTHTLSPEPVCALIFLTGRGGLDTIFFNKNFILAVLCGLWDLSFLTRDWTQVSAVKAPNPKHWTTREFPRHLLKLKQDMSPTSFQSSLLLLLLSSHLDAKTLQRTDRCHMTRRLKAHMNTGSMLLGSRGGLQKVGKSLNHHHNQVC